VSASRVTADATFVAKGRVRMSASTFNLTPHENNVVIISESDAHNAVTISGSQLDWQGLVFASEGGIMLFGSEFRSPAGGLYGEEITLAGGSFRLGALPGEGSVRTRLTE
jgi:hypothetical protein